MATKAKRKNFLEEVPESYTQTAVLEAPPTKTSKRKPVVRLDRIGKRGKVFFMNEAAEKQLSILAIEQDATQQDLLNSAVNALFIKYGKKPIA